MENIGTRALLGDSGTIENTELLGDSANYSLSGKFLSEMYSIIRARNNRNNRCNRDIRNNRDDQENKPGRDKGGIYGNHRMSEKFGRYYAQKLTWTHCSLLLSNQS